MILTLEEFYIEQWHQKWPDQVLNDPDLARRRKRSHSLKMLSIDRETIKAEFESSREGKIYVTTLTSCTCKDFALGRGERPCKHIFRLAEELGVFQNEHFKAGETDYTLEAQEQEYFAPKIPLELGRELIEIAKYEGRTLAEQVNIFLERSVSDYLKNEFAVIVKYNGVVDIASSVSFADKSMERPSYLPSYAQMEEWKERLTQCSTEDEGIKLINELKLTIPVIRELADYMGISLTGCKYLKSEIIRWLVNGAIKQGILA